MLRPIEFFSKRLKPTKRSYSDCNKELLMEVREFHILTDHKPLTHAVAQSGDSFTSRVCRQLTFIQNFTTDIRHIRGEENPVADAL